MNVLIAIAIGVLFGAGFYQLMKEGLLDKTFGLLLLSHGANFVLLTMAGLARFPKAPLLPVEAGTMLADPLPQALILTALVIGFAVAAFLWALVLRLRTEEAE